MADQTWIHRRRVERAVSARTTNALRTCDAQACRCFIARIGKLENCPDRARPGANIPRSTRSFAPYRFTLTRAVDRQHAANLRMCRLSPNQGLQAHETHDVTRELRREHAANVLELDRLTDTAPQLMHAFRELPTGLLSIRSCRRVHWPEITGVCRDVHRNIRPSPHH